MKKEINTIKSKRLKLIRTFMYLDALLILLSFMMLDVREFSLTLQAGICIRIGVLVVIFGLLLAMEKSISRYLRKHRNK